MNDYGIKGGQGRDEEDVACAAKWLGFMLLVAAVFFLVVVMSGCMRPDPDSIPILR